MDDGPRGHGWWQASDMNWYPPEQHPDYVPSLPSPPKRVASDSSAPRRLSEGERNQILDSALASRLPTVIIYDGGRVSGGPQVRRSSTSAEIIYDTPLTHPGVILLNSLLSVLTCGLYIPWWFYRTFRRPDVSAVFVDEYGKQHWGTKSISTGQRVLCVVVGLLLLWWLSNVPQVIDALQTWAA